MASRLSDETLKEIYESGTQGLLWQPDGVGMQDQAIVPDAGPNAGGSVEYRGLIGTVDLDALLDTEDPAEAVALVDPTVMYHSLLQKGPEDSLDIIPLLTPEQFVKVVDYEGWDRDRLSLGAAMRWLDACRSVSKEELFRKFSSLEEEVQIGLLGPFVDFLEEDQYEHLPQEEQDTFQQLPCRTAWWRIKSDDPTTRNMIEDLVDGGSGVDLPYTYSLLAHAANLPPNEQEEMARQFRTARLEEDGFVAFAEAQTIFRNISAEPMAKKYGFADVRSCLDGGLGVGSTAVAVSEAPHSFFNDVIAELRRKSSRSSEMADFETADSGFDPHVVMQTLAHLINTVCSAVQVTPENEAGMKLVMSQVKGLVGSALDLLSESDVARACRILSAEHPRELFRFTLGVVDVLRSDTIQALRDAAIPAADKIERLWRLGHFGKLLYCIDTELLETVGFESAEMLKGLFNRFPMRAVSQRFLPDGDRRIVFRNLSCRTDVMFLSRDVAQINLTWRRQQ